MIESLSAKAKLSLLQKEYRKFFRALLKEYKVASPAKLSIADKKEFFGRIKKEWPKAKKAALKTATASVSSSVEWESLSAKAKLSLLQKEYRKFFKALLKQYKVTSPAKLSIDDKKEFFGHIKKDWPKAKKAILKKAKAA